MHECIKCLICFPYSRGEYCWTSEHNPSNHFIWTWSSESDSSGPKLLSAKFKEMLGSPLCTMTLTASMPLISKQIVRTCVWRINKTCEILPSGKCTSPFQFHRPSRIQSCTHFDSQQRHWYALMAYIWFVANVPDTWKNRECHRIVSYYIPCGTRILSPRSSPVSVCVHARITVHDTFFVVYLRVFVTFKG